MPPLELAFLQAPNATARRKHKTLSLIGALFPKKYPQRLVVGIADRFSMLLSYGQ